MTGATTRLHGIGKALLWGTVVAGGLAVLAFLFGFLTSGFSVAVGLEWARRVVYVLGAVCLIVGGAGLFFSGSRLHDERVGARADELREFEHTMGISWTWAVVVGSVPFFLVGTLVDCIFS